MAELLLDVLVVCCPLSGLGVVVGELDDAATVQPVAVSAANTRASQRVRIEPSYKPNTDMR